MKFDDQHVDAGRLDDRRGMSTGARVGAGAGGLGVVGVLILLLVNVLGGGASGGTGLEQILGSGAVQGSANGESVAELQARCNADGSIDEYEDCYVLKVFNEVDEVWAEALPQYGTDYEPPRLVFFEQGVSTGGCGYASTQSGPFYCPADRRVYLDLGFLQQLLGQFGASGRYAEAYVVAHEAGHHLQTLLDIEPRVRQLQQQNPGRANALSVNLELQADCFAGVWGGLANERGNVQISPTEYDEALTAAAAVGDDRIQAQSGRRVNPESFTHGSSEQRQQWFARGFSSTDLSRCDTFAS